jgi:hypothetical protein
MRIIPYCTRILFKEKYDLEIMGFARFLGKVAGDIRKAYKERKNEIEFEEKEKEEINNLLDKFEYPDLEKLCQTILGAKLEDNIDEDDDTGKSIKEKPSRRDYLDYIWENLENQEMKFSQIKDYALKDRIVTPSFFGLQTSTEQEKRDFENIISIISQFQPEKATNEKEHFQPQLFVYLKARFPDKKIEREVPTKNNQDYLDIVIDNKYVLELKIYSDRSQLRALGAQLEEYKEKYPYVCAVILDNENSESSKGNIKEYTDKYKVRNNVPCIILSGTN